MRLQKGALQNEILQRALFLQDAGTAPTLSLHAGGAFFIVHPILQRALFEKRIFKKSG